jgi:hypothetical protein
MELQKINVKFFLAEPDAIPLATFIDVFHGWIQGSDGVYHDVADYSHMHGGPGIVLIANNANVSIDETGNRRGLLYSCKSYLYGSNVERLKQAFRAALENCRRLEQEPALRGKLKFRGNEALIAINDRLLAPNTEESFETIKPEIESLASTLYDNEETTLERDKDPDKRLTVRIKTARPASVDKVLKRLAGQLGTRRET